MRTSTENIKRGAVIVAGLAVLFGFAANAEGPHHKKGMHEGQNPPTFAEVDADSDGFIVAEELYQMHGKRMAARAAEGRKLENAGKGPNFEKIDTDGDGKLTAEEFAAHQAQCRHAKRTD